jgi:hypothetical protein
MNRIIEFKIRKISREISIWSILEKLLKKILKTWGKGLLSSTIKATCLSLMHKKMSTKKFKTLGKSGKNLHLELEEE